jgi:hypothetical protein
MINGKLRPWGQPNWLFRMPTLKAKRWFLMGCISTQDRCQAMLLHHSKSVEISGCGFVEISDCPSSFSSDSSRRLSANRESIVKISPAGLDIFSIGLLDPILQLMGRIKSWVEESGGNIILDVSTLPERFCLPIIRWLSENPDVKSLVIAYMIPDMYTDEDLGYDSQEWKQIPTFVSEDERNEKGVENVIVGVGFLPYSLPHWLKNNYDRRNLKISLLMPFPAAPSSVNRAWEFVRRIEKDMNLTDDRQIVRVAPHDLCGTFERIDKITKCGKSRAVFAPYGPKAQSVAMCLHALKHPSEIYFTQPTYYHPEYSLGMAMNDGLPSGYSYVVRLEGVDFY